MRPAPRPGTRRGQPVDGGLTGKLARTPGACRTVFEQGVDPGVERRIAPGLERLLARGVEVHGAGVRIPRRQYRRGSLALERGERVGIRVRHAELDKASGMRTEQARLVDGLRRGAVHQLERAIRREHEQWRAGGGRLHHGGQVVGTGTAGRADQERGGAARSWLVRVRGSPRSVRR